MSSHENPARSARRYRRLSQNAKAATRGASLVEIMIVLVILLIGVFLAVRIFPTGFATLRANQNRTSATRLAERLLSLAKGDASGNLPEAVLSAYVDTNSSSATFGQLIVDTTIDPDDLSNYIDPNDTTKTPNLYFSNVNRFHFIKGEQVKIPLPTTTLSSGGTGSVYTVQFGPMFVDATSTNQVGLAKNAPDYSSTSSVALFNSYLAITGAPLTAIPAQAQVVDGASPPLGSLGQGGGDASGNLRGDLSFLIDYGDDDTTAYIMFAPRAPASPARTVPFRTFTVTYSYLSNGSSTGPIQSNSVTVTVPDSATATWQTIPTSNTDMTAVKDLVAGSVTAVRQFSRIHGPTYDATGNVTNGGDAWDTSDPYQYKLAADNINEGNGIYTSANIGAILFNPAGANYTETTAYGSRPFTAFIDYAVMNWHIIHDDIQVPTLSLTTSGFVPVQTAISPIKQVGDTESDANGNPLPYNNLFNDSNFAYAQDILVYDLSNPGAGPLQIGNLRNPKQGDQILTDGDPRGGTYKTGTIYINQNTSYFTSATGPQMVKSGATLRVMYQGDGDWAVAMQKATAQYTCPLSSATGKAQTVPADDSVSKLPAYNSFGESGTGTAAILSFPRSELNKAVSLSLEYQVQVPDSTTGHQTGQWVRLNPVQVIPDTVSNATTNSYGKSVTYATALVEPYIPTAYQKEFESATNWRVAVSNGAGIAYGTSVKARVIWHDADTSVIHWRVQDLDSNLTPSP